MRPEISPTQCSNFLLQKGQGNWLLQYENTGIKLTQLHPNTIPPKKVMISFEKKKKEEKSLKDLFKTSK